jgi:hypothetical protein
MESLPQVALFCIFDNLGSISLISMAMTSRTIFAQFCEYWKQQDSIRRKGLSDLGLQVFMSQFRQRSSLKYFLFRFCDPLTRIPFMLDLPKQVLVKMNKMEYLSCTAYPHDIEIKTICNHLPLEFLHKVWSSKVTSHDTENFAFADPNDPKRFATLYANDTEHTHLSKMTLYLMHQHAHCLVINDRFLGLLTFWILVEPMSELCGSPRYFRVHLNQILPWILLFPSKQCRGLVMEMATCLNGDQLRYLINHMKTVDLVSVMRNLQDNPHIGQVLVKLHREKHREFFQWLTTSTDGKKILKKTIGH